MKTSLRDRFKNAVEIASEVQQRFFKEISARTIQRRLKEMGLMARIPAKKPLLNQRMKKARLNWAKNKENLILLGVSKFDAEKENDKENDL